MKQVRQEDSLRNTMKVGIVGAGAVGTACATSLLQRGSCHEIVLLDKNSSLSKGVATDLSHGIPLCPSTLVRSGGYKDLANATVVIVTAGFNEKTGGADDPNDKEGRLRLIPLNAEVYDEVISQVVDAAPDAIIIVVTNPPEALADVARKIIKKKKKKNPVISTGTYLDTLRFRIKLAEHFRCDPKSVDAQVIGEHGTSHVCVWSSAQIGGERVIDRLIKKKVNLERFRKRIEKQVKTANLEIIKGTGASRHGIGMVAARIVEAILRDEGLVAPVGQYHSRYGITLSLPSVIGRKGAAQILSHNMTKKETAALAKSAAAILDALAKYLPDRYRRVRRARSIKRMG